MLLKLSHVDFCYPKNKHNTIEDICVDFEKGKMYAIVGKSGCGKTTLLSLIAALDSPTKGEVIYYGNQVDGERLTSIDPSYYRGNEISLIFQNYQLFPLLTAKENVELPLTLKKDGTVDINKKVTSILNMLDIQEECYNRFPTQLSGGEQQRIAIARALTSNPKLILADEPTGNLDEVNSKVVMETFKKLSKQGICVIIVTHDKEIANQCDIIMQMKEGKLEVVEKE